ncbi:MAG: alpha-glucan family phosphorylase [Phycisphaeraceae bacterium]|nr:alpha-glucan family phosphorylase [Phycisphaeraceae bacterium]
MANSAPDRTSPLEGIHPGLASLPAALAPAREIALNMWWSWNPSAAALFESIDPGLWERYHHNPTRLLINAPRERLAKIAQDPAFLNAAAEVYARFQEYMKSPGRFGAGGSGSEAAPEGFKAAYFCAEFGLAECFQIYCGGLGLLAGDHLKSAAELKLPLVAVGLLYSHGYFTQSIDRDGWQHELTPPIVVEEQPIRRVIDPATGEQVRVHVELPGRMLAIAVWRCDVGTVPLYLLDTNIPENSPEDRDITRNLYMGDHNHRIKQELVLGVGGIRALGAVGEKPTVFHMNEGHAAFLALERIRVMRENASLTFDQTREAAAAAHVFTTHTPLPAGIDRFHTDLIRTYLTGMLPGLGLDIEGLLALGRERVENRDELFSMAVLAIRTSRWCNGVSRLHGEVSREMWRSIWPQTPEHDVPIGHVTNGIHTATWVSPELAEVYTSNLGSRWKEFPDDPASWDAVDRIPDESLWRAKQAGKRRLIEFARRRLEAQWSGHRVGEGDAHEARHVLDEGVLTIGFARRFAAYKRATLLFRDQARFARLLGSDRPIQILIAGKAHPGDHSGKLFIKQIIDFARNTGMGHRLAFLENYDIDVARHLVQGVDIWLNNPIRGLEASGTSGMKAALNGGINCSILDGWWDEAFDETLGFAISGRETTPTSDAAERDERESLALYALLEDRIIPEFYAAHGEAGPGAISDSGRLPRAWIARMKRCIATLGPQFSTHRMVSQYARQMYLPAFEWGRKLAADGLAASRALSDQIDRLRRAWRAVRIVEAVAERSGSGRLSVSVRAALGELTPDEVQIQVYSESPIDLNHRVGSKAIPLSPAGAEPTGTTAYMGAFPASQELLEDLSELRVRIIPRDSRLITPMIPGLVADAPLSVHADAGRA